MLHSRNSSLPLLMKSPIRLKRKTKNPKKFYSPQKSPIHPSDSARKELNTAAITERFLMKSQKSILRGKIENPPDVEARLNYFDSFKNLPKLSERNNFEHLEDSPNLAYLNQLQAHHLMPKPFGIIRKNGSETKLDIHGFSMGDYYADAFSEGIKRVQGLESLNLKSNRLTERGSAKILEKITNTKLKDLSLAENKIGMKSVDKIVEIIDKFNSNLKHLNLENTAISNVAASKLCDALALNRQLTRLNLARNNLGEVACRSISKLLKVNDSIKRLDLHWNCIRDEGAISLFNGLAENTNLKQLDVSWNSMGNSPVLNVAGAIGEALKAHLHLIHIDLSYNYFTIEECKKIGKGIQNNHSLLGIHMSGNDCMLNSRGFIIPIQNSSKYNQSHFFQRIIEPNVRNLNAEKSMCWVCEKWVEMEFYIKNNEIFDDPVFLHLECDEWEPDLMVKQTDGGFKLIRVVPPGEVNFFFTYKGKLIKSADYKLHLLDFPKIKEFEFWPNHKVSLTINTIQITPALGKLYKLFGNFEIKPRIPGLTYKPPDDEYIKPPWDFNTSIFKEYIFNSQRLLNNCFEFDWRHARISNFIKDNNDRSSTKEVLRSYYSFFKETYKYLASFSGSEIFSIGSNIFTDFLNQCGIIDSLYEVSDLGVNWNSSKIQKEKGQTYNPGSALVRYEFMEILVRIANDRYVRTKICPTVSDAIQRLINDHLMQVMPQHNTELWRKERYICEEVDVVYKAKKASLEWLYKKYSGKKTLPGQKNFMCLEEFRQLCNDVGLLNDNMAAREIDLCFSQAMMSQVDEIYKKRHIEMSFIEFLEAFARACDLSSRFENGGNSPGQTARMLKERPLYEKIHSVLKSINNC